MLGVVFDASGGPTVVLRRESFIASVPGARSSSASSNAAPLSRARAASARFLSQRPMIAQVLERRDEVVAQSIGARPLFPRPRRLGTATSPRRSFKLEHDTLRRSSCRCLECCVRRATSARCTRYHELAALDPRQHGDRELGTRCR